MANFAFLPDGRGAAFDWTNLGAAPATLDLGWYLAVNSTRLARGKDAFIALPGAARGAAGPGPRGFPVGAQ